MTRLRNRLIAAFLASTLLPLCATVWITTSLLDRSLGYATTGELDRLSQTLEATAKQFYQRERDALKQDALAGRTRPTMYAAANAAEWPEPVRSFWDSGEPERFAVSGASGERVDYMRRADGPGAARGVEISSRDLGGVSMEQLSAQLRQTRRLVNEIDARDLRRGFTLTLLVLLGAAWLVSLLPLVLIAHRVSRPIQQLTAALTDFAGGDSSRRLETGAKPGAPPRDEVGRAVDAFNHMADQLEESRERLVHLTRMASWQSLARKTAHELKNSLTPIRLMVEEMQARQPALEDVEARAFMDQAVQIVVSEIESLERRVRAFSEFASEPHVHPENLDINAVVTERVALLRPVNPGVTYRSSARRRRSPGVRGGGSGERDPDEPPAECGGGGRAGRRGPRADPGRGRTRSDRCARFRTRSGRGGLQHVVRADDYVQEARDGARSLDRQEERPAV